MRVAKAVYYRMLIINIFTKTINPSLRLAALQEERHHYYASVGIQRQRNKRRTMRTLSRNVTLLIVLLKYTKQDSFSLSMSECGVDLNVPQETKFLRSPPFSFWEIYKLFTRTYIYNAIQLSSLEQNGACIPLPKFIATSLCLRFLSPLNFCSLLLIFPQVATCTTQVKHRKCFSGFSFLFILVS